ncbi:small ubiquitin-related modifier 2-like [Antechinus flavipes]|uniref:small ubiquitin-related modifier 2-like n=1 Tax=Antechinus flavipes TaxID=38775 RepID=UPI002235888B|nr:small ubiquitin-related modifier 2-like [Antechinus flavipes]
MPGGGRTYLGLQEAERAQVQKSQFPARSLQEISPGQKFPPLTAPELSPSMTPKSGISGRELLFRPKPRPSSPLSSMAPKEGVKTENNDHINLKVAGQDGSVVQFKIKRHTPLSKLMKAYCERQGLSMRQIRFQFDGQPINETDTPAQLEMEDEDTIDIFQQQTGGIY